MRSLIGRLVACLLGCLLQVIITKAVYKEDVLYMTEKEVKVIRLQDFIHSGIMTRFEFEQIDPIDPSLIDPNSKTPIGLKIFDSKTNLYQMTEATRKIDNATNETISLDDIKDINSGIDQYLLARSDKNYTILLLSDQVDASKLPVKPNVKKTITAEGADTLYSHISDRHHFMFFESTLSTNRTMLMYYAYLDAENDKYFTDRANVTLSGLTTTFKPKDFNVNINFTSNTQIEVLGYHSSSFDYYDNMFFYINITLGSSISVTQKLMKIEIEGHSSSDLQSEYTMISAGLIGDSEHIERLRIVLKSKKGAGGNLYMMTLCKMLVESTPPLVACSKPTSITGIRLLNDTLSRGIDFRNGQFGIITEQFLLHPTDDTLSKFRKIYLKIDQAFIKTTSISTLEFASKNDKYIGLALGPNIENITSYYIIEYGAKEPEVFTTTSCKSKYFRMQGGNLFMTEPMPDKSAQKIKHIGLAFSDAYILLDGLVVRSRMKALQPDNVEESLKFTIVSKVSGSVGEKKNFTVVLVQKVMNAIEIKTPFDYVKIIRGGATSLTLKEEYFIGNDVLLNISTNTTNLHATVLREKKHKIMFKNYYEVSEKKSPVNPSKQGNKVDYIKLVSDNLLLISQFESNSAHISICFINLRFTKDDVIECELYSSTTIGSEKVVQAFLLNFDHYLLITKSISVSSSDNTDFHARIYQLRNTSSENKNDSTAFLISKPINFKALSTYNSFICYTFSASAVITYISKNKDAFQIKRLEFKQLANNTYSDKNDEIKYDSSLITTLVTIVPDYTSKSYFYLGLYEMNLKFTTYQAIAKVEEINNTTKYSLSKIKEISTQIISSSSNSFCAGTQELVSIGSSRTGLNYSQTVYDELIFSVPFEVKHSVYQKMVRRLPLESLGLERVMQFDCMGQRNSLIVIGANLTDGKTGKNVTKLINYDLAVVNDPRKRIETIMDLQELNTNGLLLTSSSYSYSFMDFMVLSNLVAGNESSRDFMYIMQPIKQITFEISCPFSEVNSVPISMDLRVNHSPKQVHKSQELSIEVKPLDYSTVIVASNDKKLSKEVGFRELEISGILTITGHFYKARLWDTEAQKEIVADKDLMPIISLQERQKVLENFTSSNSMEVRMIGDILVLREVTGNIEILYNKNNRSEKHVMLMQCNSLMADYLFNNQNGTGFYLFLIEDIIGGVIVRYREVNISNLAKKLPEKQLFTYEFNKKYDGVFKQPASLFCGINFYFLMHSKISNEVVLSVLDRSINSTQAHASNVTIKLSEDTLATELVCLNDNDNKDSSIGLIVVYPNQTQILYKYRRETDIDQVKSVQLNFATKRKLFFHDVECEIGGSKLLTETKNWEIWLKCFYATRWSDDYVVNYTLNVNPSQLDLKSAVVVQEVKEIKNFQIVKTIAEDNKLLLVGFNLEEHIDKRKIYVLVYNFSLNSPVYVTSYFTIDNYGYIDYERFRQLIHVNYLGQIVYLDKRTQLRNTFNQIIVVEIGTLGLNITKTTFNPNNISLEILDLNNQPLEKISLINLFSLQKELTELQRNNVVKWLIIVFFGSIGLLLSSVCFYVVMNRLYIRKLFFAKKMAATSNIRISLQEARAANNADIDLEDENSQELINELVRGFKDELNAE